MGVWGLYSGERIIGELLVVPLEVGVAHRPLIVDQGRETLLGEGNRIWLGLGPQACARTRHQHDSRPSPLSVRRVENRPVQRDPAAALEAHWRGSQVGWNRDAGRCRGISGDGWPESQRQSQPGYEENTKGQGKVRGSHESLTRSME